MSHLRTIDKVGIAVVAVLVLAVVVIGAGVSDNQSRETSLVSADEESAANTFKDEMSVSVCRDAHRWTASSFEKMGNTQVLVFRCGEKKEGE
jgi:hypothetical protein